MLSDYFEPFILLERVQTDNDLGSMDESWQEGIVFQGAVTHVTGRELDPCGLPALKTTPMLLHEWDVTLAQGDRIRRQSDGAEYRVAGSSGDMRTPSLAGMAYCQVPVERLVTAP